MCCVPRLPRCERGRLVARALRDAGKEGKGRVVRWAAGLGAGGGSNSWVWDGEGSGVIGEMDGDYWEVYWGVYLVVFV